MTKEQENKEREDWKILAESVVWCSRKDVEVVADYFFSRIQAREEELKKEIEELGHQQEDDTIWCKMDDILALFTKK